MRFHTTILGTGKTTAGIEIPAEVVESLRAGRRPPVRVTINGYAYRSTVAVMGGAYMVGLSNDHRAASGLAGGDEVDVDIELDTEPREVSLPTDFAEALAADPAAQATFEKLSNSNKGWHTYQLDHAKTDATRQRRIARSIAALKNGLAR